jgi:hypothetical protein
MNKLSMNTRKSKVCHFNPTNTIKIDPIKLNGITLETCESVKYLGVHIDDKLNWKSQVSYVTTKLNKQIGILKYARKRLRENALRTIYLSLSHSVILYGIEVWGTSLPTIIKPLKIAQNKLLRTITFSSNRTSIAPLATRLKILPLGQEIQFRRLLAAFKIITDEQRTITINTQHAHSYETRFSGSNIPIPSMRLHRHGRRGIRMSLINAFNSLPLDLKALFPDKPRMFKMKVKEFIWLSVGGNPDNH